eukprot:scaffold1741_cov102-Isochrysis_galbana.AAC.1
MASVIAAPTILASEGWSRTLSSARFFATVRPSAYSTSSSACGWAGHGFGVTSDAVSGTRRCARTLSVASSSSMRVDARVAWTQALPTGGCTSRADPSSEAATQKAAISLAFRAFAPHCPPWRHASSAVAPPFRYLCIFPIL